MKKSLIILAVSALILVLTGCGGNSSTTITITSTQPITNTTSTTTTSITDTTLTTTMLEAPENLSLDGRELTWDFVPGATSYSVKIDETNYPSETNSFTIPSSIHGDVTITVQAISGTEVSESSLPLDVILTLVLSYPENIRQEGDLVLWDAVEFASGYVVKIDGVEYFTYDTSYPIDPETDSQVQILAVGDDLEHIETSAYSPVLVVLSQLDPVTNIRFASGMLQWDVTSNADTYLVTIGADDPITVTTNNYADVGMYSGVVTVTIVARNSASLYLDSEASTSDVAFPEITLSQPTNLRIDANTLGFDPVEFADTYDIYWNGALYITVLSNSYPLTPEILADETSYLQVVAKSALYQSSPLSDRLYVHVILITNETELRNMATTGNYLIQNDISLTASWTPLDFSGNLDGGGHTISDITIDSAIMDNGFFAILDGARVTNLNLAGSITIESNLYAINVGGLAARAVASEIENVAAAFTIAATSNNGIGNVGGLVGLLVDSSLANVGFTGTIETAFMTTGGLVGTIRDAKDFRTITKAAVTSTITATGTVESPVGGFVGQMTDNYVTISESYAKITLVGANYVGGFIGYLGSGTVEDCYVSGSANATNDSFVHLGGFVGHLEGYNVQIVNSLAMVVLDTEASGIEVYVGSFTGKTPGGTYATIYHGCQYDNLISPIDRIGNPLTGRGDGISGTNLASGTLLDGFNPDLWYFSAGEYPLLAWENSIAL